MGAYGTLDQALPGLQFGLDVKVRTGIAQEAIAFGKAIFGHTDVENKVYGAHFDRSTITLDADLVASNVLTLTVNGTAVAVTYGSSHAASMTAMIAALNVKAELVALGISAAAGSSNRIIVLTGKGLDITTTGAVTLGSSQAGVAVAADTWAKYLGVALFTQKSTRLAGAGSSGYAVAELVNIIEFGNVWVHAAAAVNDKQPAYAIYAAASQGQFTNSSSGTYETGGYFRTARNSQNLAVLEVRGLK